MDPNDILFPESTLDVFGNFVDEQDLLKTNKDRADNFALLSDSYKRLFDGQGSKIDAERVIKDLYHVCYGNTTTYTQDPREHAFREGAKNVLIRVLNMCKIDVGMLYTNELNNK